MNAPAVGTVALAIGMAAVAWTLCTVCQVTAGLLRWAWQACRAARYRRAYYAIRAPRYDDTPGGAR